MAAAFELTATPELSAQYSITIYQQGWRLGGKGASGRNAAMGNRIEEHGLHMWMGFYQNAFAMIKRCYGEWAKVPSNPFQDWSDAFSPQESITLGQTVVDDSGKKLWGMWHIPLPKMPGEPGDGAETSLAGLALALMRWLVERHSESAHMSASHIVHHAALAVQQGLLEDAPFFERLHTLAAEASTALEAIDEDLDRLLLLIRIGWAVAKGMLIDVLPHGNDGFRKIDHLDFRAWLMLHGLKKEAAYSAPIKALYDLGFAYADGDTNRPTAGAGVALYVMLNIMFGSRGAALYRMNAGMGDTVFTPFYDVLRARGVQFEFFSRVEALHLSPDSNLVASIDINQQVELTQGQYTPLVDCAFAGGKQLPCWPSQPDWTQITDGTAISEQLARAQLTLENSWCAQSVGTRTLKLGQDFDQVVLGISLAGLRTTCAEIIAAHSPFAAMVDNLATVQTQAIQVWLKPDTAGLGWKDGPTVLTSYADPLSTWADMSHLSAAENWPADGPKSIAYFCGPLADNATTNCMTQASPPACATGIVEAQSIAWLNAFTAPIWPAVSNSNGFDWTALYDPAGGNGVSRMASQYIRANIDPTERYVLSLPGTVQYRLKAGQSGVANLFLAGDWVETRMNSGCVEAAIEGGMRAAQAISGFPQTIYGSGREG